MKILKTTLAILCGLLVTGCSSIQNTTPSEDHIAEVTTLATSETSNSVETSNTETTTADTTTSISEDTITEATTTESTSTTTDTEETSISESDTQVETSATTNEETSQPQDSETTTPTTENNNSTGMPIPTSCDSEYITDEMCQAISEYFNSMVAVDVDTFKAKQLSAYNQYMEEYLEDSESSIEDMLNIYYDNYLLSVADETLEYTAVTFDNITLEYPNDVDSILNTMEYITQLDDVTEQYENYTISDELTAYYQLNYAIDYTLTADGLEDFTATKSGSILVLDLDGEISLIMLY